MAPDTTFSTSWRCPSSISLSLGDHMKLCSVTFSRSRSMRRRTVYSVCRASATSFRSSTCAASRVPGATKGLKKSAGSCATSSATFRATALAMAAAPPPPWTPPPTGVCEDVLAGILNSSPRLRKQSETAVAAKGSSGEGWGLGGGALSCWGWAAGAFLACFCASAYSKSRMACNCPTSTSSASTRLLPALTPATAFASWHSALSKRSSCALLCEDAASFTAATGSASCWAVTGSTMFAAVPV
mmetsp:Transcript_29030/g.78177  ORF Transcript_29030/g.78177 Transcript_29030/m.78177 type:complete len:243 (-) Transcript_29030:213-941(-)